MEADTAGAMMRRLAFITARGLPWQQDPLALSSEGPEEDRRQTEGHAEQARVHDLGSVPKSHGLG